MKKRKVDLFVVMLIALVLTILHKTGMIEGSAGFLFIPLFIVYYFGQSVERLFRK